MAGRAGGRSVARMTTTPRLDHRGALLAGIALTERRVGTTAVLEGGEGPELVLLHGPAGSATHWLRVAPALLRTHRVVIPDLPGHGASELPDDVDAWLGDVIAATCHTRPTVIGYALGGAIAARSAPDAIAGLVLVDALGLEPFSPAPAFGAALHGFLAAPSERTHDELWRYCAHDLDALRERMPWEPFRAYNLERAPAAIPALGELMPHFTAPVDLSGIRASLIWGRHDLATPLRVAEAASAEHGWPLHVIEDCADDPPLEQPEAFLTALRTALVEQRLDRRTLVGRRDPGYDELRRVYNGMIDRRPALIARCASAADVAAAVDAARTHGLELSVYGGGHNVTGNAVRDDALMIDLRPMKRVTVDPQARVCRAEAGLTWGELDAATQAHGLAVTGGRISTTGVAGLALGGGSGWIERACGYAVDNLLAVELVTADGRTLVASEDQHPDLFWATRGGGGNFGVATAFEFRLHPIGPTVLGGLMVYPATQAPDVLRTFARVMADAPDELGAGVALLTGPPGTPVEGRPVIGVVVCFTGPPEAGREALRPLRAHAPALDTVGPMPYVALQQMLDDGYPHGLRNYWTGDFLAGLPEEAIEILCHFHASVPSPLTQILVLPGGGAAARVPDGALPIDERGAPLNLHITSLWPDPSDDEANIAWTRAFANAIRPFTTGRVYVNFIGDEGRARIVASFGEANYRRLQQIKARYDPDNLFRASQNIPPA